MLKNKWELQLLNVIERDTGQKSLNFFQSVFAHTITKDQLRETQRLLEKMCRNVYCFQRKIENEHFLGGRKAEREHAEREDIQ